jgi:3D-(3,5/4)-trihydroxycyclohexane-1,2-dione acylhydrolase (decyclizing)
MTTIRLTAAQAMVRYLAAQLNEEGVPFLAGCWAIFGHGNVAGIGEALHAERARFTTWRGHNEQGMAHAAIAYAKQLRRRRAMAVTASIGPGATNMVTACALAHVNRLPVLFIPGDVFAGRGPDPVLQQIEDWGDGTVSANDCFRPVSRYFDRIQRPEQLLTALPRAFATMTDPLDCGPVTLAFCQDVQAEAFDFPEGFFAPRRWTGRRPSPDPAEVEALAEALRAARQPLVIAGGGVHYAQACDSLRAFVERHGLALGETQAGKSALPWDHPLNLGGIGVTGSSATNAYAAGADLVLGVGTRFQDFTTGSWALFRNPALRLAALNIAPYDAAKRGALPVVGDAGAGLRMLSDRLGDWRAPPPPMRLKAQWLADLEAVTAAPAAPAAAGALPSDQQVIGAVQRQANADTVVLCAAGTMPGELQKLWKAGRPGSYHMEYGYSCMGYEIAGGLGVKMAEPERDVIVMVGDGSYMMLNAELATAAMMGIGYTVVLTDNRGYGCINRLQIAAGGAEFNNLIAHCQRSSDRWIDFAQHARSMGAEAVRVGSIAELEAALARRHGKTVPYLVVIDTTPYPPREIGGFWWDVAVPEVSARAEVVEARRLYEQHMRERAPR